MQVVLYFPSKPLYMTEDKIRENPLLRLSINFSILVIEYCEILEQSHRYVISNQLLRAATSIGANAMEAQNAESKADFIHKMKIAAKEADETQYWLLLCKYVKTYPDCDHLFEKLEELQKILNAILGSARK